MGTSSGVPVYIWHRASPPKKKQSGPVTIATDQLTSSQTHNLFIEMAAPVGPFLIVNHQHTNLAFLPSCFVPHRRRLSICTTHGGTAPWISTRLTAVQIFSRADHPVRECLDNYTSCDFCCFRDIVALKQTIFQFLPECTVHGVADQPANSWPWQQRSFVSQVFCWYGGSRKLHICNVTFCHKGRKDLTFYWECIPQSLLSASTLAYSDILPNSPFAAYTVNGFSPCFILGPARVVAVSSDSGLHFR